MLRLEGWVSGDSACHQRLSRLTVPAGNALEDGQWEQGTF